MSLIKARELVKRGWAVFPIAKGKKFPACPHGFLEATRDDKQLVKWFSNHNHNIGIATGFVSGIVVLDIDAYKPECQFLALLRQLGWWCGCVVGELI